MPERSRKRLPQLANSVITCIEHKVCFGTLDKNERQITLYLSSIDSIALEDRKLAYNQSTAQIAVNCHPLCSSRPCPVRDIRLRV